MRQRAEAKPNMRHLNYVHIVLATTIPHHFASRMFRPPERITGTDALIIRGKRADILPSCVLWNQINIITQESCA